MSSIVKDVVIRAVIRDVEDDVIKTLDAGGGVPAEALLTEAGDPILTEGGDYILIE